jgi:hypothetical protein
MELLDDEAQVEARFDPLEVVLTLTQDRCTICAKHTTGSKIILDATMELESHFGPFGDSVSVGAR